MYIFFFKQKPAYEMRISDWSSDVCSSDLSHLADDGSGEGVGPSRAFALSAYGEFRAGGSEEVEGQVPEDGEVFRSVVGAVAGGVLVEGHVEHPMAAVLDGPVGADGAGEAFRGEAGGGKIGAGGGATDGKSVV